MSTADENTGGVLTGTPVGLVGIVSPAPSADEAAAIVCAAQTLFDLEARTTDVKPWPYQSKWRRAAIVEAIRV